MLFQAALQPNLEGHWAVGRGGHGKAGGSDIFEITVQKILFLFFRLQNQMQEMLQKYSVNEGLLTELERLREENKRLKAKF